eukprot:scaffold337544_cov23-Prasinocladus_malaysianus.AAC.1
MSDIFNKSGDSKHLFSSRVVKLSGAVQQLPKEHTEFVHGVSPSFIDVGVKKRTAEGPNKDRFSRGFYFIGKSVG